jgi:serine/threonine-protein kinase
VSEARSAVPPHVAAVLAKALEKLPADRFESAKAFGEALDDPGFSYTARTPGRGTTAITAPAMRKAPSRTPLLAAGAVAVLALALVAWTLLRPEPVQPLARLDLALGDITPNPFDDVVISPDGTTLAVAGARGGEQAIWIRRIGEADFTKLAGTESGRNPSFSPDSRWLVFRRQSDQALVKVSSAGGGTITLHQGGDPSPFWPHWGTPEWIVFISPAGLFRVPATGGTPEQIPGAGGLWPFLLPDGSGVLHAANNNVNFYDFATDSSTVLVPSARHQSYVATGHLLYVAEDGGLFAVPFDLGKHEVTGPPVRVLDRVAATGVRRGYSISRDGILVHHEGRATLGGLAGDRRFLIMGFDGGVDTVRLPSGGHFAPRFSPDGRMIAYGSASGAGGDDHLFTFDLVSGTNTQITFEGTNDDPIWSPDGTRLVFEAENLEGADGPDLYVKAVDNSTPPRQVLTRPGGQWPTGWLADGTILYTSFGGSDADLFTIPVDSGGEPRVYLEAPWWEAALSVSPDGSLGAFEADEAGRRDIWLRTFPVAEGKWRVTTGGMGLAPRWSPDGQFVYFVRNGNPEDSLFRVPVERTPQGGVVVRGEELVFTHNFSGTANWDLHPDGRRAVITDAGSSNPTTTAASDVDRYLVVLNWFSEMLSRIGREAGGR